MPDGLVYLCGPMEGISEELAKEWRATARNFYYKLLLDEPFLYIDVLDPCRRKAFHAEPYSTNLANKIVKLDVTDISRSNLVLCNLKDRGAGKAWGSVMELVEAYHMGKPVITVLEEGFHHPFIEVYSTEIHHTLEDALNASLGYFR